MLKPVTLPAQVQSLTHPRPWPSQKPTIGAAVAPGKTAKLTTYLEPGVYDVIAWAQSGPTKLLRTELTVRPELMNMANDLLAAALEQEREQIDEKLFFEVFALDPKPAAKR